MIRVSVTKENGFICQMTVTGHSGSAKHGEDLVCAGVSAIVFGLFNALDQFGRTKELTVEDNLCRVSVNEYDEKTDLILKTGIVQLQTVQESYSKFIDIKITEV